jgi:putative FmdB family regulatory protein
MPCYQYKCRECGEVTERITNNRKDIRWCEKCGGLADRIFCSEGGSFRKGEGYWADD